MRAVFISYTYLNVPIAVQNFLPIHDARVAIPFFLFIVSNYSSHPILQIQTNFMFSVMKVCCPNAIVTRAANMSTEIAFYSIHYIVSIPLQKKN